MPEATVHEDGYPNGRKDKIRIAVNAAPAPPSDYPMFAKDCDQAKLCREISASLDA